jgi:hypothetical protein
VVWREIKQHYDLRLERNFFVSCRQWLFNFLERGNELHAAVLAVTFWFVWEACNEARKSVIKPDLKRTCSKILAYVELINLYLLKAPSANRRESKVPSKWTLPPPGVLLVNVDAAVFEGIGKMGAGVVVRTMQAGVWQHVVITCQGLPRQNGLRRWRFCWR